MIIDQLFTQPIFEDAPMASPEQIAYNQLRAQWEGYQKMTSGGGNTAVSRDPAHAAKLATVPTELARMAAALKAKGIDAEAQYDALSGPAAAPVDANQAYGGMSEAIQPGVDTVASVKKLWHYINRNLNDLASNASFEGEHSNQPYIEDRLANLLKTADGNPVTIAFDMGGNLEFDDNVLYVPVGNMWRYRGLILGSEFVKRVVGFLSKQGVEEVAPPGARAERMVRHIKQGYARDGKLTPKEKGIAFATAWKAHNAGRVEEQNMAEAAQGHTIEAHGVRGMDRRTWHKTFRNTDQMIAWAEKHDAEIMGTRDLEQARHHNLSHAEQGMDEGVVDTVKKIGKKLIKPVEVPGLNQMKAIHNAELKRELAAQNKKYAPKDVSEAEKNPHTSALGRALYRDLSKEKKASPQQVQRNKERWAQRQAEREQGVAEGSLNESDKFTSWYDWKDQAKSSGYTITKKDDKIVALNKQGQIVGHWSDVGKFLSGKAPRPNFKRPEEQGVADDSEHTVSFRDMVDVVDKHYPKYYAELSGSNISDKQFEQKITSAYKKIMQKQGVAEGFDSAAFDRHMDRLRAQKELEKTDPMRALVNKMHSDDAHSAKMKRHDPSTDNDTNIHSPFHPSQGVNIGEQGVAEGEIERQHGDIKPWAYWSFPERVAKKLYQIHKGQPIGKTAIVQLWKTDGPDRMTKFMFKPDVSAILSAYQQMSEQGPLFKPGVAEADKHSFIGRIQRHNELKNKVDRTWRDAVDAENKGDKSGATRAFNKHVRYTNLERPGTWRTVKDQDQDITEMDKSEPSAGRDTGPRSGPDREAKPITAKKATKDAADMLTRAVKDSHKKKDVKESDTLMLKLNRALVKEGRVKELADDLKTMADADFMKKYGKAKAAIRKDMNKLDEAPINELSTNKLAQYKTAAAKDAQTADKAGDVKRGDKRFGGIVKATKKQFDNDAKKVEESRAARRALMAQIVKGN